LRLAGSPQAIANRVARTHRLYPRLWSDEEGIQDGMQHHTFTLFESRGELDDDLYTAYYEKLRELMTKALKPLLDSEDSVEAKRVIAALDPLSIKRIW
jgi:hypothetical protein